MRRLQCRRNKCVWNGAWKRLEMSCTTQEACLCCEPYLAWMMMADQSQSCCCPNPQTPHRRQPWRRETLLGHGLLAPGRRWVSSDHSHPHPVSVKAAAAGLRPASRGRAQIMQGHTLSCIVALPTASLHDKRQRLPGRRQVAHCDLLLHTERCQSDRRLVKWVHVVPPCASSADGNGNSMMLLASM